MADSMEEGADVIQWTCTGNASQKWYVHMVLDPLDGELIRDFDRLQNACADAWAIRTDLQNGALVYGDREVTYTELPAALEGAEYVVTPCDAKNLTGELAAFTAAEDMTVYVALDARVTSTPSWLADWTRTEMTCRNSNDVEYVLYARQAAQGEVITLGANEQASGCVQYTVMAVRAQAAALTGDVDGNGVLGVNDAVGLQKWLVRCGTLVNDGDINGDGVVNVIDLALLKAMLTA